MSDTLDTASPVTKPIAFMIGDPKKANSRVSLVLAGKWRSFLLSSDQGSKIAALLRAPVQDIEAIGELADIQTWVAKRSQGRVTVDDCDRLRLDGKLIDYGLTGRIGQIIERGIPFEILAKFIERLDANPDQTVKEDLYRFMEKGDLLPDPEGFILGFKKVDTAYKSFASGVEKVQVWKADAEEPETMTGRILYPVGGRLEMNREDCDPNRDRTCSRGLHVCSYEYLNFWYKQQGVVLIVRVDPANVTAIPADHDDQKLRCCALEIISEIPEAEAKTYFRDTIDKRYPAVVAEAPATEEEPTLEVEFNRETGFFDVVGEDGEQPSAPSDAVNDSPDAPVEVQWSAKGHEAGLEAGRNDRENEYDYDPAISDYPQDMPAEDRPIFCKGFFDGYELGYKGVWSKDWTLELARVAGAAAGLSQAEVDHPAYDNAIGDEEVRDSLVAWVEETFPDYSEPEGHEFVLAFDRASRDAYHERFNALEDGAE